MKSELNIELLYQAVEFAEAHQPSNRVRDRIVWDQDKWRDVEWKLDKYSEACGTAMCLAGITCHITGGIWLDNRDALRPVEDDDPTTVHTGRGIPFVQASTRAQRLLGLTNQEKNVLFSSDIETIDELRYVADQIKNNVYRQNVNDD